MNRDLRLVGLALAILAAWLATSTVSAAKVDVARLAPETWKEFAPRGKEVDCIYGDWVLRNDRIVVVIAAPLATRNANMTVRTVGWAVIDLTRRQQPNDQLSAFYPNSLRYKFSSPETLRIDIDGQPLNLTDGPVQGAGDAIVLSCRSEPAGGRPPVTVRYTLRSGEPYLLVETQFENTGSEAIDEPLSDSLRADRSFQFGTRDDLGLFWADDEFFRQTYGIVGDDRRVQRSGDRGVVVQYVQDDTAHATIPPGGSFLLRRKLFPAASRLEALGLAAQIRGQAVQPVSLEVQDPRGPVRAARVELIPNGQPIAAARSDNAGKLDFNVPPGSYQLKVRAPGRPEKMVELAVNGPVHQSITLDSCGYVRARVSDQAGQPIPCKVAFQAVGDTPEPDFGPDSAVTVKNLKYSHNGRFRQELAPGRYRITISYGPEYDAIFRDIEVKAGEETPLNEQLVRSVDTSGWVSADFHSHSTPSGDNTTQQRARVLNLLCEHIEFAPCTEHNRISSYTPHLKQLKAEQRMATCTGIELTGQPLPVNHQNAFPLRLRPRTQDNGAPQTDENPLVQIERLAMWEPEGEKRLLQGNHPNLVQVLGDRDLDNEPDGGFAEMFKYMDVVEVHPLHPILLQPGTEAFTAEKARTIFHWLQMLNLGYRIPGVVNTDAHYSFHGSGGLRNFLRCSTDDPAAIATGEMVRAAREGRLVMSNGPFLTVTCQVGDGPSVGPGEDVAAPDGSGTLHVRVQCPNWLDVNRVQVLVNGRPHEELNFTRNGTPDRFDSGTVKFDQQLPLKLAGDSHVIVVAAGEGLRVGDVMGPEWGQQPPMTVSNPIFVDVDGNGFRANGDLLDFPLPLAKTVGIPIR